MNRATINCARLVHFDDISCGSVVHQVDRILTPPTTVKIFPFVFRHLYLLFLLIAIYSLESFGCIGGERQL